MTKFYRDDENDDVDESDGKIKPMNNHNNVKLLYDQKLKARSYGANYSLAIKKESNTLSNGIPIMKSNDTTNSFLYPISPKSNFQRDNSSFSRTVDFGKRTANPDSSEKTRKFIFAEKLPVKEVVDNLFSGREILFQSKPHEEIAEESLSKFDNPTTKIMYSQAKYASPTSFAKYFEKTRRSHSPDVLQQQSINIRNGHEPNYKLKSKQF